MPTIGDTSENASANADLSVKSLTGVADKSVVSTDPGAMLVIRGSFLDPVRRLGQDRLRARARGQVQAFHVPGNLAEGGDPEAGQLLHAVDQLLEGVGAGGAAGEERMAGEDVGGA